MTPAQAMHDAFWDEGLRSRKGWPSVELDQAKWTELGDRGLVAARHAYASGARADDLHRQTANALANAYFDISGETAPSDFDWPGFKAALVPAARSLINTAKATSHERRAA